jgi:hypothetical protein
MNSLLLLLNQGVRDGFLVATTATGVYHDQPLDNAFLIALPTAEAKDFEAHQRQLLVGFIRDADLSQTVDDRLCVPLKCLRKLGVDSTTDARSPSIRAHPRHQAR